MNDTRRVPVADAVPLDEVMLAMDVVDTLRHQREQVAAELNEDERQRQLIDRVRSIYESQGMDVPEEVIAQGVRALAEERFEYRPPRRTFAVRLAEVYVERGKWALRAAMVALVAVVVWAGFAIPAHYRRQARIEGFRSEVAGMRREVLELDQRSRSLRGQLPEASAAGKDLVQDAEQNLSLAAEDLRAVGTAVDPGPDPATYLGDADRLDALLVEQRETLNRASERLGKVQGHLEAIAYFGSLKAKARRALERLAGKTIPAPLRQRLETLQASVLAAIENGDSENASAELARLTRDVDDILSREGRRDGWRKELQRLSSRLVGVRLAKDVQDELAGLKTSIAQAIENEDSGAATRDLAELGRLVTTLDETYTLRIVSSRGKRSGVWRYFRGRKDTRNYYIIVEAIGPDRRVIPMQIRSEENNSTRRVKSFGVRVPKAVYDGVGKDKTDNGIIDNRRFGLKRRGERSPEYFFPVSGGMITTW